MWCLSPIINLGPGPNKVVNLSQSNLEATNTSQLNQVSKVRPNSTNNNLDEGPGPIPIWLKNLGPLLLEKSCRFEIHIYELNPKLGCNPLTTYQENGP